METAQADLATRYRTALEALGRQDLSSMADAYAPNVITADHAQQRTMHGVEEVIAWCREWLEAFPDSRITDLTCDGAGRWTIARFTATGINHGPMGPLPATGNPMTAELCSVARWEQGRIVEEHIYYDQHTVLAQLGHLPGVAAEAT